MAARSRLVAVNIYFHVSSLEADHSLDDEGSDTLLMSTSNWMEDKRSEKDRRLDTVSAPAISPGRPDVKAHIRRATREQRTLGIAVCGPNELAFDVRNTVSEEQMSVAQGKVRCVECYLHTETFGW